MLTDRDPTDAARNFYIDKSKNFITSMVVMKNTNAQCTAVNRQKCGQRP